MAAEVVEWHVWPGNGTPGFHVRADRVVVEDGGWSLWEGAEPIALLPSTACVVRLANVSNRHAAPLR